MTTAGWQNKTSLAHIPPHPQQQQFGIHPRSKVLFWELWDPGRRCKTSVQSENEENHFENTCLHQGGGFADPSVSSRPENSTISLRSQLQPCFASVLSPTLYAKGPRKSIAHPCVRQ